MSESAHIKTAPAFGSTRRHARFKLMASGEALFVGGWSLMWASSLDLIAFVPVGACLVLMLAGLVLAAFAARRSGDRAEPESATEQVAS